MDKITFCIPSKNNQHGLQKLKEWVGERNWNVNLLTYPEHLKIH